MFVTVGRQGPHLIHDQHGGHDDVPLDEPVREKRFRQPSAGSRPDEQGRGPFLDEPAPMLALRGQWATVGGVDDQTRRALHHAPAQAGQGVRQRPQDAPAQRQEEWDDGYADDESEQAEPAGVGQRRILRVFRCAEHLWPMVVAVRPDVHQAG